MVRSRPLLAQIGTLEALFLKAVRWPWALLWRPKCNLAKILFWAHSLG